MATFLLGIFIVSLHLVQQLDRQVAVRNVSGFCHLFLFEENRINEIGNCDLVEQDNDKVFGAYTICHEYVS